MVDKKFKDVQNIFKNKKYYPLKKKERNIKRLS